MFVRTSTSGLAAAAARDTRSARVVRSVLSMAERDLKKMAAKCGFAPANFKRSGVLVLRGVKRLVGKAAYGGEPWKFPSARRVQVREGECRPYAVPSYTIFQPLL